MKLISKIVAAAAVSLLLAGCLSSVFNLGSAAEPPTNVTVIPGDSSVTVTWSGSSNVQYWLFAAQASAVTPDSWNSLSEGRALINVGSPLFVTGLTNGKTYSFTLNGRTDNGPGGAGSPSVSAVPRLAGESWTIGSPLANDLRAATFGTVFVAVGAQGALYSSPDINAWTAMAWTPQTNPLPVPTDLNAAFYDAGLYLVAGANGALLTSLDAVAWSARISGTSNALYGIAGNGLGGYVAVGEKGTILVSADAVNWTSVTSGTTNDLFGVTYGYGVYIAVGANGTLLASTNATSWVSIPLNTVADLRGIAYGINTATASYEYMVVGAAGTRVASIDGLTWNVQAPPTTRNLNAITYNRQFIIVGEGGTVITSADGSTMQLRNSGTSSNLTAVTHSVFGLSAVGLAGANLTAL